MATALALPNISTSGGKKTGGGSKTDKAKAAVAARARSVAARARELKHLWIHGGEVIGTALAASFLANLAGQKVMGDPAKGNTWVRPFGGSKYGWLSDLRLWAGLIVGGVSAFGMKKPSLHGVSVAGGLLTSYLVGIAGKMGAKAGGAQISVMGMDNDGDEVGKFSEKREKRIQELQARIKELQDKQEYDKLPGGRGGAQAQRGGGRRMLPVGVPAGSRPIRVWDADDHRYETAYASP